MFLIYCNQKGCGKNQEPLLNLETDEVICRECNKAITNVTPFSKAQMKSLGQIKRKESKQESFAVKCVKCSGHGKPLLDKQRKIICSFCKEEMTELSKPYQQMIKNNIKSGNQES